MTASGYAPYCLIDGRVRASARARISIFDRGFLYGEGLFETLPIYGGQPFLLSAHLARLCAGAQALCFQDDLAAVPWADWVQRLVAANRMEHGVVRIAVTRGAALEPGLRAVPQGPPTLILTAAPPRPAPPGYGRAGMVVQRSAVRHPAPSMLPTALKHSNYLVSVRALEAALRAGADEALLLNEHGRVCEAATSNLFCVTDDGLITPSLDEGPLAGTTRQAILDAARALGLPHAERPLSWEELVGAQECFLTNALSGPVPVRAVVADALDSILASWSAPGPWTLRLAQFYWARVRAEAGAPWWPVPGDAGWTGSP